MPSARHHNEWLSLIDVSGPFLSVPVLEKVFPQGLDAHDPDHARVLKLAFEEWEDNQQGERASSAIHRAWIDFVLEQTLGLLDEVIAEGQEIPQTLRVTIAEHGETLRPDLVVRNPEGTSDASKVRMLVQVYPVTQGLEKPVLGRHWKASPATRMMELLHATDVRLGLVTNGKDWMLVDAPTGEKTGSATWDATFWVEEPLTLRAFRSLLGVRRFFGVGDGETLEAMLRDSASNQQEVTDRLGYQVREAVEEIIRALDRVDQDAHGEILAGIAESELYEAALTVMMRLVFLFSAEERVRRTEQVILEIIDSASRRLTVVSYAVYSIPNISAALVRAVGRGVGINVIVETPDKLEGKNAYNTLQALGAGVADGSAVYYWPRENRGVDPNGKVGILHVKCVVADGQWLFLSSANLTDYAFSINMELGLLDKGGALPGRVETHFDQLIERGVLARV
jgi:PLD-like domain